MKIKGYRSLIIKVVIVVIICALPPLIINKIATTAELMGFWGNYINTLLGALISFLIFFSTYRQNKVIINQNEIIKEQNKTSQKNTEKQMNLNSRPFLDAADGSSNDEKRELCFDINGYAQEKISGEIYYGWIDFRNGDYSDAYNVKISSHDLGNFLKNTSKCFKFKIPKNGIDYFPYKITYEDRENRKYEQNLELAVKEDGIKLYVLKISPPKQIEDNNEPPHCCN